MMTITAQDRIAALEVVCRAEIEGMERMERAGNSVAAHINRQRALAAQRRLTNFLKSRGIHDCEAIGDTKSQ